MMNILNHPELAGFYSLAAVAIFASLRVVTQANPVHAILSMIVSLLAIAGIFFVLGAPFAGALEIVVYAGAIMVLFVFVIMMLNLGMADEAREERWLDAKTWAIPTGLTLIIAVVLYGMIGLNHDETAVIGGVNVPAKAVGTVLFTKYIMLVEVAAFLLLAALVAAYHLGKESNDDEIVERLLKRGETSGRPDDANEEVIRKRLDEYQAKTSPVFEYYNVVHKAHNVPGVGSIEDIFNGLVEKIEEVKK